MEDHQEEEASEDYLTYFLEDQRKHQDHVKENQNLLRSM